MAECECSASCMFFHDKMANMPQMAEMMMNRYCRDEYQACARYRVFKALGREAVPADLFPNQPEVADSLLVSV